MISVRGHVIRMMMMLMNMRRNMMIVMVIMIITSDLGLEIVRKRRRE